jgi:hypothetical protein
MAATALLVQHTHAFVEPTPLPSKKPDNAPTANIPTPEMIVFAQLATTQPQNPQSQSTAPDPVPQGAPYPRRTRNHSGEAVTIEIPKSPMKKQTGEPKASDVAKPDSGCLPSITCCGKPLICPGCACTIL